MAYTPTMTVCEHCEDLAVIDTTGAYDAITNQGGYGGPGAPTDPSELTTQVLGIWAPGSDHAGDPDHTIDLGALPLPTPDADGYYSWTVTPDDLSLDKFVSGVWYFRITSTYGGETYMSDVTTMLVRDIQGLVDIEVNKGEPGCGCTEPEQLSRYDVLDELKGAMLAACCGNWIKADKSITWLYRHYKLCC